MNNLETWQTENKVSNKHLSQIVGVHTSLITHIKKGRRKPSPALALRIEQATGGAVTLRELLFPDKTNGAGIEQ